MIATPDLKPFASTPGRPVDQDRPNAFDIADYYFAQRHRVAEDIPRLRELIEAVNWTNDLCPSQWAQWYSLALGFQPDLILELGRGYGNSTALFTQAAHRLRGWSLRHKTRVVSLCVTSEWERVVAPRIARVTGKRWFSPLEARKGDILFADFDEIFSNRERVLMLWDAHGFDIAELVLAEILPRLLDRQHLVILHDISDNRYSGIHPYGSQPVWKFGKWQKAVGVWDDAHVNIGWMSSRQDQVVALADFSVRNELEIGSADDDYARYFGDRPEQAQEMRQVLGDEFFSTTANWAYLSLNGRAGPLHFPAMSGGRAAANRADITVADVTSWPVTVKTDPVAWAYAKKFDWQPAIEPQAGGQSWIKCRVHVAGAAAGISLLKPDGSAFVETQVVSPSPTATNLFLRTPPPDERGQLLVHTWDSPQPATVRIEDVSLVW